MTTRLISLYCLEVDYTLKSYNIGYINSATVQLCCRIYIMEGTERDFLAVKKETAHP